ncbi:MAG TPA: NAD(P)H-dependent oxidoreductase subunit E [bacterium]|nr:NAD(P)H-dependent oxidoreductase subunit E [bacterium]HNZ53933.1 NAD(P)H-dependent oxidoreductase subunit E [bacterium]HOG43195.1 NAD(P)H-dependent oxidoreductase subunit E [bacterium]HPG36751.1 NAD(P)H-dependent oxidoreductase subunit E [bacterium]HPY15540.1 NAD(P)H-dependent oxidoreductase subunit E [bacterium]
MSGLNEVLGSIEKESSFLIKALQSVQHHEGFISDESILKIADHFSIPSAEVEGVVSFYAQFKRTKPGKYVIAVCDGTACHIKGSTLIENWVSDALKIKNGETDETGTFSLELVACLGCCSLAPVMSVNGRVYGKLDRKELLKILKRYQQGEVK